MRLQLLDDRPAIRFAAPVSLFRYFCRLVIVLMVLTLPRSQAAADNSACFECHEDKDLEREDGPEGSLWVDEKFYGISVHADMDCTDCHQDAELTDDEHKKDLGAVDCTECHEEQAETYKGSLHGRALAGGDPDAPNCSSCHGKHGILPPDDRRSLTYKINIPGVCSKCHSEASGLADRHEIGERRVVETYSMSIHGEGVFKRGLTVAAVCTDCHGSHNVLPHEDPKSLIHHDNVAKTCMMCHGEIEQVHVQVVQEHLWQEQPHQIPACVDCHKPHKVRQLQAKRGLTDADCMACHDDREMKRVVDGAEQSLFTDRSVLFGSAHEKLTCAMCHSNVFRYENPPCKHVGEVDCGKCHASASSAFVESIHGKLVQQGNEVAPKCTTCHGSHDVQRRSDVTAPINIRNIPRLCGKCHREGEAAALQYEGEQHEIIESYHVSIHGKGLMESGLVVTAVCTSCHTSHGELPASDSKSSVARENIGHTCGSCHAGIAEKFAESVHSPTVTKTDKKLPVCNDCHSAHTIGRVDAVDFRTGIMDRCGKCHEKLTAAYFDTYHGKVTLLGEERTAKCADCHSAHSILPPTDPRSTLSRDKIVGTCGKCHPGSHRRFAGYLTHATHKDPEKYPVLYYTFWFMTILLVGTLAFFTLHTILWLPRSLKVALDRRKRGHDPAEPHVRRFIGYHRATHLLVIVSFFGLAITGMMLKFSYAGWAQALSAFLGGFESAGMIHRLCAILTFVYFGMHLFHLFQVKRNEGVSWLSFIFHPESLVPNLRDIKEFFQTLRWFFGGGERPDYGRYTYWEKFDYFAVFWGVAIIGLSGLMLWFSEGFTLVLPGWMLNVATIVHSDEALLASGFIFTVHFFNTHFRPERFPLDPVIFTGSLPLSEFKEERPREYRLAVQSGELDSMMVDPPTKKLLRAAHIFGLSMLLIGLTLVGLIVYAMFVIYR